MNIDEVDLGLSPVTAKELLPYVFHDDEPERYQVVAEYFGDFISGKDGTKEGTFGPFLSRDEAERCVVALASQPAQHFWAVVGARVEEVSQ